MRVYLSVDMEGIAGRQPPGPDRLRPRPLSGRRGPDGRRDQRRDRGGPRRRRRGHPRQRQPRRDVQPPADGDPSGRARPAGPEGVVDGRGRGTGRRVRRRPVRRLPRARRPCRAGPSPTPISVAPVETRLDGRPTGEYGLNAMILGAWGIPVGLVAGDDALAEEVADWLPWAERVVVKTAAGGNAAASVHPTVAADRIRAGSERAVRAAAAGGLELLRVGPPVVIEVDYSRGVEADHAAIVPGAERFGDRGVRFASDDPALAYRGFLAGNPAGQRRRSVTPAGAASPRGPDAPGHDSRPMDTHDRRLAARPPDGAGRCARRRVGRSRAGLDDDRPGTGDPAPVRGDRPGRGRTAAGGGDRRSLAEGRPARPRQRHRAAVRDGACSSTTSSRGSSRWTSRRARSTSPSRASCSASATGALVAEAEAQRLATAAIERIDAQRTVRRETIGMLGEADRPWLGVTLREPEVEAALEEAANLIAAGIDLIRIEVPIGRELADRLTDAGRRGPAVAAPRGRWRRRRRSDRVRPDREPAGDHPLASRDRSGRGAPSSVRPAGDRHPGPRRARGRRRRRLRADRPDRIRCDGRDRGRRRRARPRARRPCLRAPPGTARRDDDHRRARAARRGAGPVVGRAVRPGDPGRPRARAPAPGRDARPGRRHDTGPDHRRGAAAVADRRGGSRGARDRRGRGAAGALPGPPARVRRATDRDRSLDPVAVRPGRGGRPRRRYRARPASPRLRAR